MEASNERVDEISYNIVSIFNEKTFQPKGNRLNKGTIDFVVLSIN